MKSVMVVLAVSTVFVSQRGLVNALRSKGTDTARNRKAFKQILDDAIRDEDDLSVDDEDEYIDFVDAFGKMDRYMADFNESDYAEHYRAYERNKKRIAELNAKARSETDHGKVFKEEHIVNMFTDMTDDERAQWLMPLEEEDVERRRLGLSANCKTLGTDYFDGNNAGSTYQSDLYDDHCGIVKNQGSLGSCWAFASTAQLQCNYNAQEQETRVFSDKYATDCSTSSQGTVTRGGFSHLLSEWYTTAGACYDYYKSYDGNDRTEYDNDCSCNSGKVYGQCYEMFPRDDYLAIANAAQQYSWAFGVYVCDSFFSAESVWYGCGDDEEIRGGHAMAIVGQWFGNYVLVRNSWGSGWSGDGHVWFHKDVWTSKAAVSRYDFSPLTMTSFSDFSDTGNGRCGHERPPAKCYPRGPCDDGFMDTTDGNYNWWACGSDCDGGTFWTATSCCCGCQEAGVCADEVDYQNFNIYRFVPALRYVRYFGIYGEYMAATMTVALIAALWWFSLKWQTRHSTAKYSKVVAMFDSTVESGNESEREML